MKSHLLPILGAFAAGIAATIAFQSLTEPSASEPNSSPAVHTSNTGPQSTPIGRNAHSSQPTTILTAKDQSDHTSKTDHKSEQANDDHQAQDNEFEQRWHEQLRDQIQESTGNRLDFLAEELDLSPAQLAQIEAALQSDLDSRVQAAKAGDSSPLTQALYSNEPVAGALADTLNPDQQLAYANLKAREQAHRIESRTMQRFAALPETLNLSEQQRDQLYNLIAQEEANAAHENKPSPIQGGISIAVPHGYGAKNSFTISLGGVMAPVATDVEGQSNSDDLISPTFLSTNEPNQEHLDAVRPLLNERQQEAYRQHLEQSAGILRPISGITNMFVEILDEQPVSE
ncbi:MAG: hypothetical protein AAF591_02015 [Verrucomicrobiota bacterium]